jgi:hypothetical protein
MSRRILVAGATAFLGAALTGIEERSPDLARHLRLTIRTGAFCSYAPDPLHPLAWDLD